MSFFQTLEARIYNFTTYGKKHTISSCLTGGNIHIQYLILKNDFGKNLRTLKSKLNTISSFPQQKKI